MFFMLVRGQVPCTIVPVQFLLVPDIKTVLNVKPCLYGLTIAHDYTYCYVCTFKELT